LAGRIVSRNEISDDVSELLKAGRLPDLVVRTKPTELIVIDGPPQFTAIRGTKLSYVSNTPADVFVENENWYVLVSGGGVTASSRKGPWSYVAQKALPHDFAQIPGDSPKSAVLASVAGTPEAE